MKDYIRKTCLSWEFFDTEESNFLSEDPMDWPEYYQEAFFELLVSKMDANDKMEVFIALAAHCAEKNMNPFSLPDGDVFKAIIAPYIFNRDNLKIIQHYRDLYISEHYDADDSNVTKILDYQQRVRDCR